MQNTKQKLKLSPLMHKGNTWIGNTISAPPSFETGGKKNQQYKNGANLINAGICLSQDSATPNFWKTLNHLLILITAN
jgi:hypothetical protein